MKQALFKKEILAIISIIIVAAIIRLIAVFNVGTFHFDDMFSVYFTSMNLKEMFSFLKYEVHPPLFYLLLHFWIKIFGTNEIITRIPALIFSLACIPLLYYLGKQLTNRWIAGMATIFFTLSYFQIFSAIQVRMYSLLLFLGLASLTLFWLIIVKQKKNLWLLYILINSLLLLIHLGGIFAIVTQGLWLLILISKKQIAPEKIKKFLLSQIPVFLIWSIWFIPFFLPKITNIFQQGWYFSDELDRSASLGIFDYFFILLQVYWLRFITGVIIFTAPFLVIIWSDKKIKDGLPGKINPNWFLFSWFLPGFLVSVIFQINYIRIFIIPYLALYLILAYFFYLLFKNQKIIFWVVIIFWFASSLFNLSQTIFQNLSRWDSINQWLIENEKPKDKIIIFTFVNELQFRHYYTGNTPYQGLYPINDQKTLEQRIIEKNWQDVINPRNIDQLGKMTDGFDRIIFIRESPPDIGGYSKIFQNLIGLWLKENNWKTSQTYDSGAFFGPRIIIYQKN